MLPTFALMKMWLVEKHKFLVYIRQHMDITKNMNAVRYRNWVELHEMMGMDIDFCFISFPLVSDKHYSQVNMAQTNPRYNKRCT